MAREVPVIRYAWELLHPLEADADTLSVERHLPSQFTVPPPGPDFDEPLTPGPGHNTFGTGSQLPIQGGSSTYQQTQLVIPEPGSTDHLPPISQVISPVSPISPYPSDPLRSEKAPTDSSTYLDSLDRERTQSPTFSQTYTSAPVIPKTPAHARHDLLARRRSEAASEKGKTSRWKFSFGSIRRAPPPASGDSSSLSSTSAENQRLEDIPLSGLMTGSKSVRGKNAKTMSAYLSQNSTLSIFWTASALQIWDVGTSPPTMTKAVTTESTCILAAVAKSHVAYIIGTRDQKLTVSHCLLKGSRSKGDCQLCMWPRTAKAQLRSPCSLTFLLLAPRN